MRLDGELARELASLSRALETPDDLTQAVEALAESATTTVASYLGLSLLLDGSGSSSSTDGDPVVMTFLDGDAALGDVDVVIAASLLLPLLPTPLTLSAGSAESAGSPQSAGSAPGLPRVQIVLYASAPGAFVDLAADLAWLQGVELGAVEIDEHLTLALATEGAAGALGRESVNDQALGVLLARGRTPTEAVAELVALAARNGQDVFSAAEGLLQDL